MKNLNWVFFCFWIGLSNSLSQASELNLPEVGNLTQVGRLMVFPSQKEATWFLASGLNSELSCSTATSNSSSRACIVKVFNTVTSEEEAALKALTPGFAAYDGFRDFNTDIVTSIAESFETLSSPLESGRTLLLQTLAVSSKYPYASVIAKVTLNDAETLTHEYETGSLGVFVSKVTIRGEKTETYLAIRDTGPIKFVLTKSLVTGPMKGGELKAALKLALSQSTIARVGLESDEANAIAYEHLLTDFFHLNSKGRFEVKAGKVNSLDKVLVIVDETYSVTMNCKATLPLTKGAMSSVQCTEAEL